jgi:hypothetical protein
MAMSVIVGLGNELTAVFHDGGEFNIGRNGRQQIHHDPFQNLLMLCYNNLCNLEIKQNKFGDPE